MKTFQWIGVVLTLLALVPFFGFALPRRFHVARSIEIHAPPEQIHAVVNRLHDWPTWTAWTQERYPDMKIEFSGPEEGAGAKQAWSGKSSGSGQIEFVTSSPTEGITYKFEFENAPSTGGIKFEPADKNSTRVTWYADGDAGFNPIARYFGLLMDRFIGPDFEKGLDNLKKKSEAAKTEEDGGKPPTTEAPQ